MIEKLALSLAKSVKHANPNQTASIEVMKFSLIAIIGTGSAVILSILLSLILGSAVDTIIVLFSFMLLRSFSGGYHFRSAEACTGASIIGAVLIPHIPLPENINIILQCLTLLIILLFAPKGKNQSKIFSPKHYPVLKIISVLIVLSNLMIDLRILTLTFFIQALSLFPIILKGGDIHEKTLQ